MELPEARGIDWGSFVGAKAAETITHALESETTWAAFHAEGSVPLRMAVQRVLSEAWLDRIAARATGACRLIEDVIRVATVH